ncbi:MurR/RpiR family transcriptional regulator [Schleiferilactobacillus harbinensis]|uniref:SIS domain-containing protein n=1 Tax=Schleiferilactobacillus harbinensis TaxID=304207 RepID=A0A5P8M5N9_9LACO|nr:MurR/RpiR family transcriptional regulator [Schleiferilactobacillus harbinensis]QFR23555.1 SIS domain-containing protein [Schleiferilactobacillus harbinensis]
MAANMLLAIQERLPDFSGAERAVGKYVLAHPEKVLQMNTKALAQAAGASPATVVRFARRMGTAGYADFKIQLSAEQHTDPLLLQEITPHEDLAMMKDKLSLRIRQTLTDTNQSLANDQVDAAVAQLAASQSMSVYGIGASLLAATDFVQKFSRLGLAPFLGRDIDEVIAHLVNQPAPGVVVLISNSGENPNVVTIAKSVPAGLTTIILTKAPKSTLAKMADIVLVTQPTSITGQMRTAATTSLMAQLYAIDLVYYRYFQRRYKDHVQRIQTSFETLHRVQPRRH